MFPMGLVSTFDHLDISSVWKSLVASPVFCVCGRSSNTCFHCVHLQRQMRSSTVPKISISGPAQNAFVASDKLVCLQCDIVFGGE